MKDTIAKLCSVELDRVTAAEICIDECLTIMDRHGDNGETYQRMRRLSSDLSDALFAIEGGFARRERLIRIRACLTEAIPMTDEDLEAGSVASAHQ